MAGHLARSWTPAPPIPMLFHRFKAALHADRSHGSSITALIPVLSRYINTGLSICWNRTKILHASLLRRSSLRRRSPRCATRRVWSHATRRNPLLCFEGFHFVHVPPLRPNALGGFGVVSSRVSS